MRNNKDVLKEVSNINSENLAHEQVAENQNNVLKNELLKVIDGLKERNDELNISISEEEIIDISNSLGDKLDENLDGVKYGRLLREITLRAVDVEVKNKYTEILGEAFTTNSFKFGKTKPNVGMLVGSALYYKIYTTKDTLIMYSFTDIYKVLNKIEVSIKDIKSAGFYEDKIYCIEFNDRVAYLGYEIEETKKDLDKIISIIEANGITNDKLSKDRKANLYLYIAAIILFILIFISIILNN